MNSELIQKQYSHPKTLVIDNSQLIRASIKRIIDDDFEVIEAIDGEDGWNKLQEYDDIRIVITDADMPNLNGFDLIQRIRHSKSAYLSAIPIIMVTGADEERCDIRERALSLGATDFISKPFHRAQILARIRTHFKQDEILRALILSKQALVEQSTIDPDTGVNNKRYFLQRGEQALAYAKRHNQELSFISVSIDNYDNLLNEKGEDYIRQVFNWTVAHFKITTRTEDVIAKIDDNLFAIIAPATDRAAAAVLCERIRQSIATNSLSYQGELSNISVSLGLASVQKDRANDLEEIIDLITQRNAVSQQAGGNQTFSTLAEVQTKIVGQPNINLDKVVYVIASGNYREFQPQADSIAEKLYPLLVFCNEQLNWQLDDKLAEIKDKF